jgi:hypothetical protein
MKISINPQILFLPSREAVKELSFRRNQYGSL